MESKKIILIGGGGHCRSCIDVIEQQGEYQIEGILDKSNRIGEKNLNVNIIGTDDDIPFLHKTIRYFLISLGHTGSVERRIVLFNILDSINAEMPIIISPFAYVSKHASIGRGSIIMHNAIINAGACIGENCIINSSALIEHDAIIGDHCHISTGAIINGGTRVGNASFFGSGAVAVQETRIPENAFIKANSLFIR